MAAGEHLTILDYWRVVRRAKWLILVAALVSAVVAFAVANLQPRVYRAVATMLPGRQGGTQSLSMALGGLMGGGEGGASGLPALGLAMSGAVTSQDIFLAILKSRTLKEAAFADLEKTWGADLRSKIVGISPGTSSQEKAVISLTVDALDPGLAAAAANLYFQRLEIKLDQFQDQGVRRQEAFYSLQMERAGKELQKAEEEVLRFQAQHRFLGSDGTQQKGGSAEVVGGLRSTIMQLEMQREIMRMQLTEQHPDMRRMDKQIEELKKQYSQNLFGTAMDLPAIGATGGARGLRTKEFFVPTAKMTDVQFAFLKVFRNLQIQQAYYTAALQGLAQSKYGEGGNFPRGELLDPAVPNASPVAPRVLYIVAAAAAGGLALGIVLAFLREYLLRVRQEEASRQITRAAAVTRSAEFPSERPAGVRA